MPRYQVTCHKDVYSPQVAYSLMKRYEELSGKDFIDTVKFIKFNYANVFNAFEALGITTQWYKSSLEKLKSSPHTKVDWKIFLPDIMRITKTDEKEAKEWLKYILSKVVTTQEVFQKEFFFKFYSLGNDYQLFDIKLIKNDWESFIFYIKKKSEDGSIPKVHLEKLVDPENNQYFKKVPNTSLVISLEQKENLEEMIDARIAQSEDDTEIGFLIQLSEELGLNVMI